MATPTIYRPENLLEECRDWQKAIDSQPTTQLQDVLGEQACGSLVDRTEYYGTRTVLVRAWGAFAVAANSPVRTDRTALLFDDEIVTRGDLERVDYLRLNGEGLLTWRINSPFISAPSQDAEALLAQFDGEHGVVAPADRPLRLPLHLPVNEISLAVCAPPGEYRRSQRFYEDDVSIAEPLSPADQAFLYGPDGSR